MAVERIIKKELTRASDRTIGAYLKFKVEQQLEVVRRLRRGTGMCDAVQIEVLKEQLGEMRRVYNIQNR